MARPNPISRIMQSALPSLTYQRRRLFRPSAHDVKYAYKIINRHVFGNQLHRPPIELGIARGYWGVCEGIHEETAPGTACRIRLSDKYFCAQWFITTLAHEMAHQYQWDVVTPERERQGLDPVMSHGPTFFMWRDSMSYYGIHLKTAHRMRKWFAYQDFNRC